MIPVTNLRPFTRMLMTIGQIPTSYLISMTYEEQLLWLCNYLEKTVIPAIDNNAEAVKELQDLFVELKSYVDNYFDNLDVQEEINNKLDEMAESGQLTDIIAQYLGLAGVLAYDTISNMASATNIAEGSICKTLGETTYNDGKGAFYKVRTITSSDVIDGVNIVALSASNTLVAEKMPEYEIQTINNKINNINTEINNIKDITNGIVGLTRIGTSEAWNFVYSPNGIDFYPVGDNTTNTVGDSSSITEINGTFYIVGSNRYKYSKDLVNWSEEQFILEGYNANTYPRVWANTFTYDEENNIVYSYSAYQTADENFVIPTSDGTTGHYPFKIIYQTGTINEDGSINFNQTINTLLEEANESYYDPFVYKDKIHGLMLACVKSSTLQVQIRPMTNYYTLSNNVYTCPIVGVEAPQLIGDNQGNVYCYVDCNWTMTDTLINNGNSSPHINGFFTVAKSSGYYNVANMQLIPYKWYTSLYFRHLGITNASRHALQCVENIGIKVVPTHYGQNADLQNGRGFYDSVNNGVIINSPSVIWSIPANSSITVKKIFKDIPLVFKGASSIGWKNNSDIPTYAYNKHFSGQYSRQQITVYPTANQNLIDVPFTD